MILPVLLAALAGCGSKDAPAPEAAGERSFQLIYQSNAAGEIEPCG